MQDFISIDPGATVGWAEWVGGKLHRCGAMPFERLSRESWFMHGVIEMPDFARVKLKDVTTCAFRAGYAASRFSTYETADVHEWKGSVPKRITQARAMAELSPGEMSIARGNHHVWDAIGLGLWKLGRLKR
jgi:hypothetical protein